MRGRFKSLSPADGVFNEYVYFYLKSIKGLASSLATGTTFKELSGTAFAKLPFPLPPLAEQRRIVAKIEELFSELDAGEESLRRARRQLGVYRQSLLKQAFEGKLTEHWRKQNPHLLESPDELLKRIQAERQARFEQQLQEWEITIAERRIEGDIVRWPRRPSPASIVEPLKRTELTQLPEMPGVWGWAKIGELFGVFVGATPSRGNPNYWGGEIPWVSSGEVSFNRIKATREAITDVGLANTSTTVHPTGTVILAMIGEGKTRGQVDRSRYLCCPQSKYRCNKSIRSGLRPGLHLQFPSLPLC